MSIEIIEGKGRAALYDTVTGIAFGPTFEAADLAEDYLSWLNSAEPRPGPISYVQVWPSGLHHDAHDRWFTERVDGETGLLKDPALSG